MYNIITIDVIIFYIIYSMIIDGLISGDLFIQLYRINSKFVYQYSTIVDTPSDDLS